MNHYDREREIALGERSRPEPSDKKQPVLRLSPIKPCGCSRYEHCQRCVEEKI